MIVYAECEFFIPTVHSLKEKRAILQRMTMRAKQRFNVSVAEINRAITFLETHPEWECTKINIEYL